MVELRQQVKISCADCAVKFFLFLPWGILDAISYHTGIFIVINLTGEEWTTDNILGQISYSDFVVSGNTD